MINILDTYIKTFPMGATVISLNNRANWIKAIRLAMSTNCVHVVDGNSRECHIVECKRCGGSGLVSFKSAKCHICGGIGKNLDLPACSNNGLCE